MKQASTPILNVSALGVVRGSTTILRNLAWKIDHGQHWVILGPNGSGKTSLLRVLTGYLSATPGSIGKATTLTSPNLSRTFGATVGLKRRGAQFSLSLLRSHPTSRNL